MSLDAAKALMGGIGAPDSGDVPALETLETPAGPSNFLREFQARRAGADTERKEDSGDRYGKEIEALKSTFNTQLEALKEQNSAREKAYQDQLDRQFKLMQEVVSRPVNVQTPAPQHVEQLPTLQLDDPDLVAAFNTFDQRQAQRINGVANQVQSVLAEHSKKQCERDFNQALKRLKETRADFGEVMDEAKTRADAKALLENPGVWGNVDWDFELNAAYKLNSTPSREKELEELRAYKKQNELKLDKQRNAQKQNLGLVPAIGGRGGNSGGSGLLADSILSDAKKAGKRLSWAQFGNEMKRRRQG